MIKFICVLGLLGLGVAGNIMPAAAEPKNCELVYHYVDEGQSVTEILKCGNLCFYRSIYSTIDLEVACDRLQGGIFDGFE